MNVLKRFEWIKNYRFACQLAMQRYSRLKLDFILMFLLVVFVAIFGTLFPYLMKLLVDQVEQNHHIEIAHLFSIEKLYLLVLAYAAAWLMSQLLSWCQNLFSMIMSVNFETALMYSGVENFLALQKQHQDQTEIGVFLTDLQRGASAMSEMTFAFFMLLGPIVFQLLFIFAVLFKTINIVFSACFVGTALLIFIVSILISKKSSGYFNEIYQGRNLINTAILEKVSQSYEIKIKHSQVYEQNRLKQSLSSYAVIVKNTNLRIGGLMMMQVLLIFLFLLGFMFYTAYISQHQQISSGDFVLISTYIIQLTLPFLMVSQSLMRVNGNIVALKTYRQYFDLTRDHYQPWTSTASSTSVLYQFEDATLNLGKHEIQHFNLQLMADTHYAIVGQTGRGKTSLINYLIGVSKIKSGRLYYQDLDISKHFSEEIFNQVSFVGQHAVIFSGSLKDNLVYNSPYDYTDAELIKWLEKFKLNSILEKNKITLNDDMGDVYKNFSGGEKQRISILRGVLRQPQLLILDEPTSALDITTALEIIELLKKQVKSLIIVSHSQQCIDLMDDVIDLDQQFN